MMEFIFAMRMRVPPSAVPQGEVEWFEPTARTGEGYCAGFFRIATISSTEAASATTAGWELMFPNQFVTVGMIRLFYPVRMRMRSSDCPKDKPITTGTRAGRLSFEKHAHMFSSPK